MSLAYDRQGSGPELVLIHPLGADRHVWRPVLDRLAAERDVLAIDLPGFGGTPALNRSHPPAIPSPPELARHVAAGLIELGVGHAHVAGNSLGGWVALELALAGVARSVTAIAPAGLWPRALGPTPSLARPFARRLLPVLPALMRSPAVRRLALTGAVAHPDRVPAADAAALVRAYVEAPDFTAVNGAMRSARFEQLDDIAVPLTFGWPSRDRLIARPRRLPASSRSVVLEGCGHVPMWDDPEQVADLLLEGSAA